MSDHPFYSDFVCAAMVSAWGLVRVSFRTLSYDCSYLEGVNQNPQPVGVEAISTFRR